MTDQETLKANPRSIPTYYSLNILKMSWALSKKNYGLALSLTMALIISNIVLTKIPFIGSAIVAFFSIYIYLGLMEIATKWVKNKKATFKDVFIPLGEKTFKKMLPLAILNTVLNIIPGNTEQIFSPQFMSSSSFLMGISGFGLLIMLFMSFSAPLIYFRNYKLMDTFSVNIQMAINNILPLLLLCFYIIALTILTLIALIIPFLFFTMPTVLSVYFITYICVFEDFKIEDWMSQNEKSKTTPEKIDASNQSDFH